MNNKPAAFRVSPLQLAGRSTDEVSGQKKAKTKRVPPPLSSAGLRRSPSSFSFRRLSVAERPGSAVGDWVKSLKKGVSDLRVLRPSSTLKEDAASDDLRRPVSSVAPRTSTSVDHYFSPSLTCPPSAAPSSLSFSTGLATPGSDASRRKRLWADPVDFDIPSSACNDEPQWFMHQRHRSTGALGHALRKASQVFSRSEPAEPMASDAAAANPVRHRAHSQSWTESLPKAKACDDWQVSPPPSSYSGPSHDTWSAVERSPSERSSYDGFDLTIAARQKVSLRSRLPDQAALLPDGIVPSVADFGLSLSVPSDLLERPSSPRQPGGTDSTGVTKSSTSSSLASDASSGSSIGSELGTPSLPSSPLFIDSVNFQNTDDDPAVKLDVAPAGRKPPASHFPGWAGYTVGSPDARLLKPCLVERGSYRISRTRASTDSDVCNLELAACSWPLPPPRETWYEVEAGTGRRVLRSALIDLQTGELVV